MEDKFRGWNILNINFSVTSSEIIQSSQPIYFDLLTI